MSIKTDSMKAQAQYLHYDVPVQIEGTEGLMDVECGFMPAMLERLGEAARILRAVTALVFTDDAIAECEKEAEAIEALMYRIENGCDGHEHVVGSTGGISCAS